MSRGRAGDSASGRAAAGSAGTARPEGAPGAGPGRLYIVATPIGNLGDVSFRAVEILKAVPLVAAEDTRLTRRLFDRYEITTHLVSYHAQSSRGREEELLAHLRSGLDLALVTDAGTPLISDPGTELASAWAAEGGVIVPIPGASAVLAALVASGLAVAHWTFEGFLPRSGKERKVRLARIAADDRACVIYEAPSRVPATLADLAVSAGAERRVAVCRELTKMHEEVLRGPLGAMASAAASGDITLRGEFVLVLEAAARGAGGLAADAAGAGERTQSIEDARDEVARLAAAGTKRSEAARQVAAATGLDRHELYRPEEPAR
jgi:16S rRNA (cytidine1402-2'-O)-methyltransferase